MPHACKYLSFARASLRDHVRLSGGVLPEPDGDDLLRLRHVLPVADDLSRAAREHERLQLAGDEGLPAPGVPAELGADLVRRVDHEPGCPRGPGGHRPRSSRRFPGKTDGRGPRARAVRDERRACDRSRGCLPLRRHRPSGGPGSSRALRHQRRAGHDDQVRRRVLRFDDRLLDDRQSDGRLVRAGGHHRTCSRAR